jgi:peptide/nickel transport system substrate-binding protein
VTSAIATATVAQAEQAKAAGVTITLKTVDPGVFFGPGYLQWTFSQDYYGYNPYLAQVAQSMLPKASFNETHEHDPHYISLYNAANATTDPSRRRQIVTEMQQFDFAEGGYLIPAFIDFLDA